MAEPDLVAAIDFGTTFSGYAFSFRHEYKREPLKISANNWIAGQLISLKTPTTLLLTPDRNFHSFGYDAENKYASLAEDGEHKKWLYFRRFKMMLHKNKYLKRTTTLKDDKGYEMPAISIFTMVIKFLKEKLLETINSRVLGMDENLIIWVLTVPAIWDEGAKQFMRLAAQEAGIHPDNLMLSLEPEAASLYCKTAAMSSSRTKGSKATPFCSGIKYMVLDLGGGTADITVHEIQRDETLREICKVTGGAWGGTRVDEAFYQFLVKLFGNDVLVEFKDRSLEDYLALLRDFEVKKRTVKKDMGERVTLKIPLALTQIFKEMTDETLQEALPNTVFADTVRVRGDKLMIQSVIFKTFFKDAIQGIKEHTHEVLESCNCEIDKLLLVGGFSESPMVYEAFQEEFPGKVINPQDSGLAVLKGAVLFGHQPNAIASRISRYTYGFDVFNPFIPGEHPEVYKVVRPDGRVMCGNMFEKYVEIGSEIPVGHSESRSFQPSDEDATRGIGVFISTSKNPIFVTDESCSKLGSIIIQKPNGGWTEHTRLHVSMEFGKTEFTVHIRDDCLDETYSRCYNFLD